MQKVKYGVWNGVMYDNTQGGDAAPDDLPLNALQNFNPGNPIEAIIGKPGFLIFNDSVSLTGILYRYYVRVHAIACGRCTPCRTGAILIEKALEALIRGEGDTVDWDHIYDTALQMRRACAASAVLHLWR